MAITDFGNKFCICRTENGVHVMKPPVSPTRDEALLYAAWLVALVDPDAFEFADALTKVNAVLAAS